MRRVTRTIVLVGVPWSVDELPTAVSQAESAGVRLVVADTEAELSKIDGPPALGRLPVAALSPEAVAAAAAALRPDQVVSITEMTMWCAARVREELGLPGTSSAAESTVSDKLRTRAILRERGLTGVGFWATTIADVGTLIDGLPLPVVVKPRALTGSAGVRLLERPADVTELIRQYDAATAAGFGRDELLVETYIPGVEISAEAIAVGGRVTLLSLTDKLNTGAPHFVETGHVMPSRHSAALAGRVHDFLQTLVTALGIETSALHAELKVADDRLELVEIHSRYGGDKITKLLAEVYGYEAFRAYFAAVLDGVAPPVPAARATAGVAFFTAALDSPFAATSFDFPHPSAVVAVDVDRRRQPALLSYEGVRLLYWRAGHALFMSSDYGQVHDNVAFVHSQVPVLASGRSDG